MTSPTQRSLALLRREKCLAAVVEKWNPHAKIRQDLFGFGDILAVQGNSVILVQTTSAANMSSRRKKILASVEAELWMQSPYRRIELHGWKKDAKTGKWTVKREELVRTDITNTLPE